MTTIVVVGVEYAIPKTARWVQGTPVSARRRRLYEDVN